VEDEVEDICQRKSTKSFALAVTGTSQPMRAVFFSQGIST